MPNWVSAALERLDALQPKIEAFLKIVLVTGMMLVIMLLAVVGLMHFLWWIARL